MKSFSVLLLAALMTLCVRAGQTNAPASHSADDKVIDAVMEKLQSTFKAGDYTYAIEVMYGPVVEKMGGKEKALEIARNTGAQMKEQHIVIVSWKTQKPYRYVTGKNHQYAIVPYESSVTMGAKKLHQTSFELAIKVGDAQWQFVNGDNITPEVLNAFFPDFPKDVTLPKVERNYE